MTLNPGWGLRSKLYGLLLLTILPPFGLIVYDTVTDIRRDTLHSRQHVNLTLQLLAENQKQLIDDARLTLTLLSELSQNEFDGGVCKAIFKVPRKNSPQVAGLFVVEPTGKVKCALSDGDKTRNLAGLAWFQAALKRRTFTIGTMATGGLAPGSAVVFAQPVLGPGGDIRSIIGLKIPPAEFYRGLDLSKLPLGLVYAVVDRNGLIVHRNPDPELSTGKPFPAWDKIARLRASENIFLDVPGTDGVDLCLAFAPVLDSNGEVFWGVAFEIPKRRFYGQIYENLQFTFLWILVIAIASFVSARIGFDKLVMVPIASLVERSAALRRGDFSAPRAPHPRQDEFGQLSRAFEEMAAALAQRDAERRQARRTRAQLAAIVESSSDAIIARNFSGVICGWNRGAEALFGYSAQEMIGRAGFDHVPVSEIAPLKSQLEAAQRGERIAAYNSNRVRKDGKVISVLISVSPIIDEHGAVIGSATVARDVSERMQAERAISFLYKVNLAVTATLNLNTVLRNLFDQIDGYFPDMVSHIRLIDETTGRLQPIACRGVSEEIWKRGTSELRGASVLKIILNSKKPVVVRDIRNDERIAPNGFWIKQGMISYVGVPMIFDGQVIGIFSLLSKKEAGFDETDITLLLAVASQASVAIRNSQLYEASLLQNQTVAAHRNEIHRLMVAQLNAREDEVKKIASILHDDSSQLLAAMKIALDDLERKPTSNVIQRVESIKEMLDLVENRLRNLSHELHPLILDQMGLSMALQFLAGQVSHRSDIPVNVKIAAIGRLPAALELCLYRVAQEALNNAIRHAQAKRIDLQLYQSEGALHCRVQDDGIGFDANATRRAQEDDLGGGLGLLLVRERVAAFGGWFDLDTAPGEGTEIHVTIPMEKYHANSTTAG